MEAVHSFVWAELMDVSAVDVKELIGRTFSHCFDVYQCLDFSFWKQFGYLLNDANAIILGEWQRYLWIWSYINLILPVKSMQLVNIFLDLAFYWSKVARWSFGGLVRYTYFAVFYFLSFCSLIFLNRTCRVSEGYTIELCQHINDYKMAIWAIIVVICTCFCHMAN